MSARGPYRRHSPQFKIQLCTDIRTGKLGRREALKTYNLSANLVQMWLTQFDRGELDKEDAAASTVAEYEAQIAALEPSPELTLNDLSGVVKRAVINKTRIGRSIEAQAP
ncbi:hypothetical protein [Collimonas humicola]|uniref:hypothetical protein n=1 Tax=Collimonas humicola TaxID=2825886 RepID=UPI001B8C2E36|nr:hypothetical protein [Collimonas humicola]